MHAAELREVHAEFGRRDVRVVAGEAVDFDRVVLQRDVRHVDAQRGLRLVSRQPEHPEDEVARESALGARQREHDGVVRARRGGRKYPDGLLVQPLHRPERRHGVPAHAARAHRLRVEPGLEVHDDRERRQRGDEREDSKPPEQTRKVQTDPDAHVAELHGARLADLVREHHVREILRGRPVLHLGNGVCHAAHLHSGDGHAARFEVRDLRERHVLDHRPGPRRLDDSVHDDPAGLELVVDVPQDFVPVEVLERVVLEVHVHARPDLVHVDAPRVFLRELDRRRAVHVHVLPDLDAAVLQVHELHALGRVPRQLRRRRRLSLRVLLLFDRARVLRLGRVSEELDVL
mmetsp:Transcript_7021/g.25834  ORF Transcript_7021/g.25834 Transcript_7021/m.25834 type:complete len:346 (-) Transcript_7021:216-1253(-)